MTGAQLPGGQQLPGAEAFSKKTRHDKGSVSKADASGQIKSVFERKRVKTKTSRQVADGDAG